MARLRVLGLLAALLVAPLAAAGATLEPHVAAYRLTLADQTAIGNPFIEVRGGLVIEWRLACDGWLSRQRLAFVGTLQEGGTLGHDVRFSSWESLDGTRMRYSYRSYDDRQLQEEFRGEARLKRAPERRRELHDAKRAPGRSAARHNFPDRAHAAGAGQIGRGRAVRKSPGVRRRRVRIR